jgi:SNF2 family DNA or RNA helicase
MRLTAHQAKYIAHALTLQHAGGGLDRLSQALFNASVDLNPHQIEAAVFALRSPLSKGVMLADEVGLRKTIEAGIVLCQYWAERKRQLLVICPASLRKQWALELTEKFNLPALVLDAKTWRQARGQGLAPLRQKVVLVLSYTYAARIKEELRSTAWDLGADATSQHLPVAGVTVYRLLMQDDQRMWLCLDAYTPALKGAIVKERPAQMVMLNSCFTSKKADELLSNLQLELAGLDLGLTVI